jgi:hypothetical protein
VTIQKKYSSIQVQQWRNVPIDRIIMSNRENQDNKIAFIGAKEEALSSTII